MRQQYWYGVLIHFPLVLDAQSTEHTNNKDYCVTMQCHTFLSPRFCVYVKWILYYTHGESKSIRVYALFVAKASQLRFCTDIFDAFHFKRLSSSHANRKIIAAHNFEWTARKYSLFLRGEWQGKRSERSSIQLCSDFVFSLFFCSVFLFHSYNFYYSLLFLLFCDCRCRFLSKKMLCIFNGFLSLLVEVKWRTEDRDNFMKQIH